MDPERFREGDPEIFQTLVDRYGPVALQVIYPFAQDGDHAEDLYQDVWVSVYREREAYEERGLFEAWLRAVALRVCILDARRREVRTRGLKRLQADPRGVEPPRPEPDPLSQVEDQEMVRSVNAALGALTEREMQAVQLRVVEGRSPEEVAAAMGVRKATVRSLIRNGVRRLRSLTKEEGHELSRHQPDS